MLAAAWILSSVVLSAAQPVSPPARACSAAELVSIAQAGRDLDRGDDDAARLRLDAGAGSGPAACDKVLLARFALAAWVEARKVAAGGGARDLLAPTESALSELRAATSRDLALESEYAQAAVRAAIAAAQDERDEMSLWLTHARDLSERLIARGRRAVWPRSFNVMAGELWFEVDRYEDARLAFERAVQATPTPLAQVGLAAALARLGRMDDACRLYSRVQDGSAPLLARSRADFTTCP